MRKIFITLLFVLAVAFSIQAFSTAPKTPAANNADLTSALKSGLPVVVKLGADQCLPCRAMKPVLKELAAEQKGKIIVLDLDINENRELAREFKVTLIPTVIFYDKHGEPKAKSTGYMSKDELLKKIAELKLEK
ncbi:MAG: thioredoxin family protein [Candidatus Margulisbacteria bacterium]|nr:thioredoxin family protein [Candidatus Margulisiibacteriota bacterium]